MMRDFDQIIIEMREIGDLESEEGQRWLEGLSADERCTIRVADARLQAEQKFVRDHLLAQEFMTGCPCPGGES